MPNTDSGWNEWSQHVLLELTRLNEKVEDNIKEMQAIHLDLEVKLTAISSTVETLHSDMLELRQRHSEVDKQIAAIRSIRIDGTSTLEEAIKTLYDLTNDSREKRQLNKVFTNYLQRNKLTHFLLTTKPGKVVLVSGVLYIILAILHVSGLEFLNPVSLIHTVISLVSKFV